MKKTRTVSETEQQYAMTCILVAYVKGAITREQATAMTGVSISTLDILISTMVKNAVSLAPTMN